MKKTRLWILGIVFALIFGLAACDGGSTPPPTPTPPPPEPPIVTPVVAQEVVLSKSNAVLILGKEGLTLTAIVKYSDGTEDNKVKWSSSNNQIVTVKDGVLTAVAAGNAVVTAAAESKESVAASCTIEVIDEPELQLSNKNLAMIVGKGTNQLSAFVKRSDGTVTSDATFTSDKTSVVTVTDKGVISAVAAGTATITAAATDGDKKLTDTCTIKVFANASALTNGTSGGIVFKIVGTDNNTNLGYKVKADNKNITAINIPETFKDVQVTEIEADGFRQCTKITSFSFGKNIKKIGANAFTLETEVIPDFNNPTVLDHKKMVSNKLRVNLTLNIGTVLEENALADSFFKVITVPEGVVDIPYRAFAGSTVTQVNLPTTLKTIKSYAFAGCINLTQANLTHTKVESIGLAGSDSFAVGFSFTQCGALTKVGTLPVTLKILEYSTFETCTNLSDITLNEGITKIGNTAFRHCASISRLTIPTTVTKMGENAFGQWSNAQTIVSNIKENAKPTGWHANWMGDNCDAKIEYKA